MKYRLRKSAFTIIELIVVMGIFALIVGAGLTLFSTGRLSVSISEAHIQAQEQARQTMTRVSKELRLSSPSRFHLCDSVDWLTNNDAAGSVVNFRIPVGSYAISILPSLTTDYRIRWGSATTEGDYLAYSTDADLQLLRSTYTTADGSDASTEIIAQHIASISFSRSSASSPLINIQIVSQVNTAHGPTTHTLRSSIKLKN